MLTTSGESARQGELLRACWELGAFRYGEYTGAQETGVAAAEAGPGAQEPGPPEAGRAVVDGVRGVAGCGEAMEEDAASPIPSTD